MLYSDCPEDTADIIEQLRRKEASKGHKFPSPLEISDRERRVLPLYQVHSSTTMKMFSCLHLQISCIYLVCTRANGLWANDLNLLVYTTEYRASVQVATACPDHSFMSVW